MMDLHPALPIFWAAAAGNVDRARRRYLCAFGAPMGNGEVELEDGIVIPDPPDYVRTPVGNDIPLILPRSFDTVNCSSDPRYTAQMDSWLPNV